MERKHKRGPGTEPGRVGGNQDFEIRIGLDRGWEPGTGVTVVKAKG